MSSDEPEHVQPCGSRTRKISGDPPLGVTSKNNTHLPSDSALKQKQRSNNNKKNSQSDSMQKQHESTDLTSKNKKANIVSHNTPKQHKPADVSSKNKTNLPCDNTMKQNKNVDEPTSDTGSTKTQAINKHTGVKSVQQSLKTQAQFPVISRSSTRVHGKTKESLRQFILRSRSHKSKMNDLDSTDGKYVIDHYEKARECSKFLRKTTGIIYDSKMASHECPWDDKHPECPGRYTAVLERCNQLGLIERCLKIDPTPATIDQITSLHTLTMYEKLKDVSLKTNLGELEKNSSDYDSVYFNKDTFDAAVLSAGCAIALTEAVCKQTVQNGMAIIRPPGHHSLKNDYCGYCFFNNVALAAQSALNNNLANKILIVDFDIHHGQGSQRFFYNDKRVLYFSIHRYEHGKFWPNLRESDFDHIGEGNGAGYNVNFPLNTTGLTDTDYMCIVNHILLPIAYEFQPELIILSAGYDACIGCPEGEMNVTPGFYGHLITLLSGLACGKLAACLEGGYFLPSLAEGAAMTLKALLGDPCAFLDPLTEPHPTVTETINNLKGVLHKYWKCFQDSSSASRVTSATALHTSKICYFGEPPTAPFLTRNFYPIQTKDHVEKFTRIICDLQKEYLKLGSNQLVSCCYDEEMLLHESNDANHVEKPNRLRDTYLLYKKWKLDNRCLNLEAKIVDPSILTAVHSKNYINEIIEHQFTTLIKDSKTDMFFNGNTLKAILKAIGCLLAVVESVMIGHVRSGVALIRPPGHHADVNKASGFCFINNIAMAAQLILNNYNVKRILIIDFDIHHGNGTQNIFYQDNRVLYISIHKFDNGKFFPHSQDANFDKVGKGTGEGYNINIPINKVKLSNIDYIKIFQQIILPISYSYAPEVVLVSAGFDAGVSDHIGNYCVTPECFGHFIQLLKPLASGKLILALEGGYNPATVKYSMNICIKTLLGDPLSSLEFTTTCKCNDIINTVVAAQKKYWPVLSMNNKLAVHTLEGSKRRGRPTSRKALDSSQSKTESFEN